MTDTLANVRPTPDTLLVSVHACGSLTDYVLDLAIEGRSPVAVVPCCHRVGAKALRDAGADPETRRSSNPSPGRAAGSRSGAGWRRAWKQTRTS